MSSRWFDHQILVVKDVEKAMAAYERLGFFVTPRMYHSFGSSNSLIMFRENFLELLGDVDKVTGRPGYEMPPAGLSRIAYLSLDSREDYKQLTAAGLQMTPVVDFTRPVPLPRGREGLIDCSITAALRPDHPGLCAFVSNQRRPEYLWVPEWQNHANGVQFITSVICVADKPQEHRDFFTKFVNPKVCHGDENGLILVDVSGVRIEILSPHTCRKRLGGIEAAPIQGTAGVVGLSLWTEAMSNARQILRHNGIAVNETSPRSFIIGPHETEGAVLEFTGVN